MLRIRNITIQLVLSIRLLKMTCKWTKNNEGIKYSAMIDEMTKLITISLVIHNLSFKGGIITVPNMNI